VEYKISGGNVFRTTTQPIHKLIMVVSVEEQAMEEAEVGEVKGKVRLEEGAEPGVSRVRGWDARSEKDEDIKLQPVEEVEQGEEPGAGLELSNRKQDEREMNERTSEDHRKQNRTTRSSAHWIEDPSEF
jgi:anti-sigma regulatory factor (Ser/Thr protein kinase)